MTLRLVVHQNVHALLPFERAACRFNHHERYDDVLRFGIAHMLRRSSRQHPGEPATLRAETQLSLRSLKYHWERLARRDPFFAALTDYYTRFPDATPDKFFQSGIDEVGAALRRAHALGRQVPRRRALDFGCGVGRLTNALAAEFDYCDAVDISASMLRIAARYAQHPEKTTYHLNKATDLAIFPDGTFSFVYSTLVLQHMEPRLSKRYIRELVRVLARDGLLVFQLPSHRAAHEPDANAKHTGIAGPLSADAFKARISFESTQISMLASKLATLRIAVENCSPHIWPAHSDRRGRYQINVGNHWLLQDGTILRRDDGRCPLPHDLAPGATTEVMLSLRPPPYNGTYWLEFDVVQEGVGWFAEYGSQTLRLQCIVSDGAMNRSLRSDQHVRAALISTPFRVRYPRSYAALRATRVRDLYWSCRRTADRIRAGCDEWVRRTIHPQIRRRIHPAINWWRRGPFAAQMKMYCVPRKDIMQTVEIAGGTIVAEDQELVPGGFQSYRYWVIKGPRSRSDSVTAQTLQSTTR